MKEPSQPRRRLVWLAGVSLLIMLIIPPWVYTIEGRATGDVFYQEIIPGPKPPHCTSPIPCGVRIAMPRLGMQLTIWALLFGSALYIRARKKTKP